MPRSREPADKSSSISSSPRASSASIACRANPISPRSTRCYDAPIEVTVCRQEAGAAMMALTEGRLTGRPGVCFVTRGPGATNAAHGVHIAEHDSAPMILFVGQVERAMRGRGAFQEMDYRAFFGSTAKWATRDRRRRAHPRNHPARVPHRDAGAPRPGRRRAAGGRADRDGGGRRRAARRSRRRSGRARRRWPSCRSCCGRPSARSRSSAAAAGARAPAPRSCASPSASSCRSPPRSAAPASSTTAIRTYVGEIGIGPNPKLKARIEAADLVLLVGGRMAETPSQGYTLFDIPEPRQRLVHVHADAAEIGRVYHPRLGIVATPPAFCRRARGPSAAERDVPGARRRARRAPSISPGATRRRPIPARVQLGEIMLQSAPGGARRDLHQRAPAISPSGPAASCASAVSTSSSARPPARWASACPRRSPPSASPRARRSSPSPATAIS